LTRENVVTSKIEKRYRVAFFGGEDEERGREGASEKERGDGREREKILRKEDSREKIYIA